MIAIIDDVALRRVDSTAAWIQHLSDHVTDDQLPFRVEQLVLKYLVDRKNCPICLAPAGRACNTLGPKGLRHTHLVRLQAVTPLELTRALRWALVQYGRRRPEG